MLISINFKKDRYDESIIPQVDLTNLLKFRPQSFKPSPDIQTVSIEVLAITGTTARPVPRNIDIFYDSEILAIVHRTKSKLSGLASTSVWCWLGRRTILGDQEDRKLQELATRYGTSCVSSSQLNLHIVVLYLILSDTKIIVHQLAEPYELIHILGGRLAIRQVRISDITLFYMLSDCQSVGHTSSLDPGKYHNAPCAIA